MTKEEITAPSWFSESTRSHFDIFLDALPDSVSYNKFDVAKLEMMATSYGEWVEAAQDIQENGLFYWTTGKTEMKRKNPCLEIKEKAHRDFVSLASEFGKSVASRVETTLPQDNPFAEFLN